MLPFGQSTPEVPGPDPSRPPAWSWNVGELVPMPEKVVWIRRHESRKSKGIVHVLGEVQVVEEAEVGNATPRPCLLERALHSLQEGFDALARLRHGLVARFPEVAVKRRHADAQLLLSVVQELDDLQVAVLRGRQERFLQEPPVRASNPGVGGKTK